MLKQNLQDLIKLLPEDHYTTIETLSEQMKLSKRTISSRIRELDEELQGHGAYIETKPRYGTRLCIEDADRFTAFLNEGLQADMLLPDNADERVEFLILYLLNRETYVKMDDLCDLLYVSRGTLSSDMKRVEAWFSHFDISIDRRPNHGIKLLGKEYSFRKASIAVMIHSRLIRNLENATWMSEVRELTSYVMSELPDSMINISEVAIENFVLYIYVTLKRISRGRNIELNLVKMPHIYNHEWRFIDRLITVIQEKKGIVLSSMERQYLALQLAGLRMIGNPENDELNIVIESEIEQIVLDMLTLIKTQFAYDFTDKLVTRMQLCQHMVSFDIRMRYGIPMHNPLLAGIKKEYMLGYQMASVAMTVLTKHYGKEISEDEIGYFAVIFAYAIDKYSSDKEKRSILVVCGSGKGSSRLLKHHYEQTFGDYLANIYVCDFLELNSFDFRKVDYVFTTVEINRYIPVPVMHVDMFLSEQDKKRVEHVLKIGRHDFLKKYYRPELFCTDISGSDRESVIRSVCSRMSSFISLPEDFAELVLQREELGSTDYGNLIAIPHPLKIVTEESYVFTAILEKPVFWSRYEVRVVFLLVIGEQDDPDIQKFYEMTTKLITNEDAIKKLIRLKEYTALMDIFDEL